MKNPIQQLVTAIAAAALLACTGVIPASAQRDAGASNSSKSGYVGDIMEATTRNTDYRHVLFTGKHVQLVVMTLQAGQEIGQETHPDVDQFIRIESGTARVNLGDEQHQLDPGFAVVIPAGVPHNVINTGTEPLHLYTLYSPPEHPPGTVQAMKPAH